MNDKLSDCKEWNATDELLDKDNLRKSIMQCVNEDGFNFNQEAVWQLMDDYKEAHLKKYGNAGKYEAIDVYLECVSEVTRKWIDEMKKLGASNE